MTFDTPPRRDTAEVLEELAEFLDLDGDRSVVAPWLLREVAGELRTLRAAATTVPALGLTAEQIADRPNFVGGSDATTIMDGPPKDVQDRVLEKRGEKAPKNLDGILLVELGIVSEPTNRRKFFRETGRPVTIVKDRIVHPKIPWMAATLDGKTVTHAGDPAIFEAKYNSGRASLDELVRRYYPQLQHYMEVTDLSWSVLSVIFGDGTWKMAEIPRDWDYRDRLLEREKVFWNCRLTGEPWPELPPPPNPDIERILKMSKPLDMSRHNGWCSLAPDWLHLREAAERFRAVDAELKALVNPEVRKCYGAGIIGTVSRNGAKTLKPDPGPRAGQR